MDRDPVICVQSGSKLINIDNILLGDDEDIRCLQVLPSEEKYGMEAKEDSKYDNSQLVYSVNWEYCRERTWEPASHIVDCFGAL